MQQPATTKKRQNKQTQGADVVPESGKCPCVLGFLTQNSPKFGLENL